MGDILKGIAALVLVAAAFKWAVTTVVDEAIANSDGTANGFEFECQPLEIPEWNLDWNTNWAGDSGIVVGPGGGERESKTHVTSRDAARTPSEGAGAARHRAFAEQARQMHEAVRNSGDPKREMERIREHMRRH